jgi:hypothetical protein
VVAWVGEQRTRNDWLEGQRQGAGRRP